MVSLDDVTANCDVEPSETVAPRILQKRASSEGSPNAQITATGGTAVLFNGLGRAQTGSLNTVDVRNLTNGACKTPAGNELRHRSDH